MLTFLCRFLDLSDHLVAAWQITVPDLDDAVFISRRRLEDEQARWPGRTRRVEIRCGGEVIWAWFTRYDPPAIRPAMQS